MAQPQQTSSAPSPTTQGAIAQHLAKLQENDHHMVASSAPQLPSQMKQSHKVSESSLREWLNVLGVFLVPLMIGIYTITYNLQQSSIAEANRQADIQRQKSQSKDQKDQQRETVLDNYLHDMNDLIFSKGLRTSKAGDEVRVIARAQTLVALGQLDGGRKGIAIQFLLEAGLINVTGKPASIISLEGADLSGAYFLGANLSDADLHDTDLHNANLNSADLKGTDLFEANLSRADLSGAYLFQATLSDANLSKAHLSGAILFRADLSGAILSGADLFHAYLQGAGLSGADLSGADLTHANLSGTILNDATGVTSRQLSQTKSLSGTILPDGSKHP